MWGKEKGMGNRLEIAPLTQLKFNDIEAGQKNVLILTGNQSTGMCVCVLGGEAKRPVSHLTLSTLT